MEPWLYPHCPGQEATNRMSVGRFFLAPFQFIVIQRAVCMVLVARSSVGAWQALEQWWRWCWYGGWQQSAADRVDWAERRSHCRRHRRRSPYHRHRTCHCELPAYILQLQTRVLWNTC